jgi:hypothetical protein
MKTILFLFAGVMMALALVAAAPGVAGAAPVVNEIDFTFSSHSATASITPNPTPPAGYPYLLNIQETGTGTWFVQGYDAANNDVYPENLGFGLAITGGNISISPGNPMVAVFTGNIGLTSFTLDINIGAGSEEYQQPAPIIGGGMTNGGFSWSSTVPTIGSGLSAFFSPSGPYVDTFSTSYDGKTGYISTGGGTLTVVPVPIPPALMLFAPALLGLIGIRKRLRG